METASAEEVQRVISNPQSLAEVKSETLILLMKRLSDDPSFDADLSKKMGFGKTGVLWFLKGALNTRTRKATKKGRAGSRKVSPRTY